MTYRELRKVLFNKELCTQDYSKATYLAHGVTGYILRSIVYNLKVVLRVVGYNIIGSKKCLNDIEHEIHEKLYKYNIPVPVPITSTCCSADSNIDLYRHTLIMSKKYNVKFLKNFRLSIIEEVDGTLSNLLHHNSNSHNYLSYLKSYIAQIVCIYVLLEEKYPLFRHNDLHFANILVKKTKQTTFLLKNNKYCISTNYALLLNDFDHSTDGIKSSTSQFHDIFKLFNLILHESSKSLPPLDIELIKFLSIIVPDNAKIRSCQYKNVVSYGALILDMSLYTIYNIRLIPISYLLNTKFMKRYLCAEEMEY